MEEKYLRVDDVKEMKIMNDGKVVILKPIEHSIITPLFCPVCEFPMKTADDSSSYRSFQCCNKCFYHFATPNKEKWENGWRPSKEELTIYREEREKISKPLLILR